MRTMQRVGLVSLDYDLSARCYRFIVRCDGCDDAWYVIGHAFQMAMESLCGHLEQSHSTIWAGVLQRPGEWRMQGTTDGSFASAGLFVWPDIAVYDADHSSFDEWAQAVDALVAEVQQREPPDARD